MPKAKQFPNSSLNLECFRLGQELIFEWDKKKMRKMSDYPSLEQCEVIWIFDTTI